MKEYFCFFSFYEKENYKAINTTEPLVLFSGKKWVAYSATAQEVINKAFFEGKTRVNFKKNDKETVLDFGFMTERENGMPRQSVNAELPDDKELLVSLGRILESERKSMWTTEQQTRLILNLTRILKKGLVYHRAAYSILAFLARLTRDRECAELFLKVCFFV